MSNFPMKDIMSANLNSVSSLSSAFYALKEYMQVSAQKLESCVSGISDIQYIAIPIDVEINNEIKNVAGRISTDDLRSIFNDEITEASVFISDEEDPILVSAETITAAYETSIQDFQIQHEFLSECIDATASDAQSFTAKVAAKYPAMDPSRISTYSSLFNCGDKLQALKGWISQVKINQVSYENTYIECVNREEYTGVSVWSIVVDDFFTTISSFFSNLWRGIQDIVGFFQRLWDGIVKLGKFLISKAFRYLSSNLSASGSKIGILDYPIFQFDFGAMSIQPFYTYDQSGSHLKTYGVSLSTTHLPTDVYASMQRLGSKKWTIPFRGGYAFAPLDGNYGQFDLLVRMIANACCITNIIDPETGEVTGYVVKPCDVVLPNKGTYESIVDGFTIRMGFTNDHHLIMSCYASLKQQVLDNYDDATIFTWIRIAFSDVWNDLGSMGLPVNSMIDAATSSPNYKVLSRTYLLNHIITPLTSSEEQANTPVDFAAHYSYLSPSDLTFNISSDLDGLSYDDGFVALVYRGFVPYFALMSPTVDIINDGWSIYSTAIQPLTIVNQQTGECRVNTGMWSMIYPYTVGPYIPIGSGSAEDLSNYVYLPDNFDSAFKPYCSYELTPASVHLQTLQERAKEIEWSIIAVIVAIAAIAITVKFIKFKHNLNLKTEIARGQADAFAWRQDIDFSDPENVKQYAKLRRKAKKLERLQSLFGKASAVTSNFKLSQIDTSDAELHINQQIYKSIIG